MIDRDTDTQKYQRAMRVHYDRMCIFRNRPLVAPRRSNNDRDPYLHTLAAAAVSRPDIVIGYDAHQWNVAIPRRFLNTEGKGCVGSNDGGRQRTATLSG